MELNKAVILFVGVVVAVCSGLPAQNLKDEVEAVKPVGTYGDQPIIDTGFFSGWDNPLPSNPFGGLFDSLESVMETMRRQITSLVNQFPLRPTNSSDDSPAFPGFINGVDLPAFPGIGDIDLSKGNSTSITKVIDGHTVVINETEYKSEDENGGTFFKVRIIDFKPDESDLTTEGEAEVVSPAAKDREYVDNSFENEITKNNEVGTFDASPEKLKLYA